MRRARANPGRQAAVAAAMVAAVIDAATAADNAAAVNRLNPLIIFVKAVAPATAFFVSSRLRAPRGANYNKTTTL
jgi:hypothetical protein